MLEQVLGSTAVAQAVALCRPEVISASPIIPQAPIIERLRAQVRGGGLTGCEFLDAESACAAMSVVIGAAAGGGRAYTATASQGLLAMAEGVHNAAGLGLPIVMTVTNRAIGAPISIWNDHSDAMSQRDTGWVQLYAETSQEAVDLHIQAFRIAEELSVPVMVCMDGFLLTHACERVDMPVQAEADAFLPRRAERRVLSPADPGPVAASAGPESFTEVHYLAHVRQLRALGLIPSVAEEFSRVTGRDSGGLVRSYLMDDARTVVVALGSVLGTIKDAVDGLRADGMKIGVLGITTFRPFPVRTVRQLLGGAHRVVVLERAFATGMGGIVAGDIQAALRQVPLPISTVIAGLGGRPITEESLIRLFVNADAGALEPLTFLDLDTGFVERELQRVRYARGSENLGPLGHLAGTFGP